jgi:hypothetical protein
MGLHQDKDESERSIAAGLPVVSVSVGDTARFLFGGLRRKDPVESRLLASGDAFVFGGPARLRYHGVSRIIPATAPPELELAGRFNLTFRQYDISGLTRIQVDRRKCSSNVTAIPSPAGLTDASPGDAAISTRPATFHNASVSSER